MEKKEQPVTRREVLKKAAFVTPIVLSLPAAAAFAQSGSGRGSSQPRWHHHHNHR